VFGWNTYGILSWPSFKDDTFRKQHRIREPEQEVSVWERGREIEVCVCVCLRETVCVHVWESACLCFRVCVRVCVLERLCVCACLRASVCVRVWESACVCVWRPRVCHTTSRNYQWSVYSVFIRREKNSNPSEAQIFTQTITQTFTQEVCQVPPLSFSLTHTHKHTRTNTHALWLLECVDVSTCIYECEIGGAFVVVELWLRGQNENMTPNRFSRRRNDDNLSITDLSWTTIRSDTTIEYLIKRVNDIKKFYHLKSKRFIYNMIYYGQWYEKIFELVF